MQKLTNFFLFPLALFFLLPVTPSFAKSESSLSSSSSPSIPNMQITLGPEEKLSNHPVTTSNSQARAFFNQGLTFLYAFNHDAAYWSFHRAAELDPQFAMAYWGMAMSLKPDLNDNTAADGSDTATTSIEKALKLAGDAKQPITQNEKDYIHALSLRFLPQTLSGKERGVRYAEAMKAIMQQYQDDLDAAVLYVEAAMDLHEGDLWSKAGEPQGKTEDWMKILEEVMRVEPYHLGANHYYIHLVEDSSRPECALICANRLATMSTTLGHILHMPTHIYIIVGDYHEATLCNERAVKADLEYIKKYGEEGSYPLSYLTHNLYFLTMTTSLEGAFLKCTKSAEQLSQFYTPRFEQAPRQEFYVLVPMYVLLRFHQWKEIEKIPEPEKKMKVSHALWHFGQAMAAAALGKQEMLASEEKQFLEESRQIPEGEKYANVEVGQIFKIATNYLNFEKWQAENRQGNGKKREEKNKEEKSNGEERKGEESKGVEELRQAREVQKGFYVNSMAEWMLPIQEELGEELLAEGKYGEAEKVFRENLKRHPRYGRSLGGLLESLREQSRWTDVDWVDQSYRKAIRYEEKI